MSTISPSCVNWRKFISSFYSGAAAVISNARFLIESKNANH